MDKFVEQINSIRELAISNMPFMKKEVDEIIENKVTSIFRIERTLDNLLSFIYCGCGEDEFKRLNSYYQTVNQEYSKEYDNFFNEI